MKFVINSTTFLQLLKKAAAAINSSPVLPILADFKIEVAKNRLTVTATDLEITIVASTDLQGGEDGSYCVPSKILLDTLSAVASQPITFGVQETTATLTTSQGKYKIAVEPSGDFPNTPTFSGDFQKAQGSELLAAFDGVLFACSNDELRPAMTGVYCESVQGRLGLCATDAHKLATFSTEIAYNGNTMILPQKAVKALKAMSGNGDIEFAVSVANAFFQSGETTLAARLIDARYPDYNAVIPRDNPITALVNRTELMQSLKRVALFANKTTNQAILEFSADGIQVRAADLDFANEANEQISIADYQGQPLSIGFNARFLVESLNSMECEKVKIEMSTPSRAAVLVPENNTDRLCLIMPVMLSS